MLYLDEASTAKYKNVDDIIVDTITTAMKDSWQNPSSLYAAHIKNKIDICRENIANYIGAKADEIYFTSGGSESNNLAIQGFVKYNTYFGRHIYVATSAIEHKSILDCVDNITLDNATVCCIGVDKDGIIDTLKLRDIADKSYLEGSSLLVSIQLANNEIGVIQNIKEIAKIVHQYNGVLHVDSVQAFGHIPINVEELDVDMMSVSGHKISPVLRGIGFLYKKKSVNIQPLIYGAQEQGLRGGTENTYGIIGLNKAIEYCPIEEWDTDSLVYKRNRFIKLLKEEFDCKLNGHEWRRLPNNISVTFPDIAGENLLYMLDMSDLKISTGSACNSKSIKPSYVLKAIGLSDEEAMRTVRFTLPDDITYKDIDLAVKEIGKAIRILRAEVT